MRSDSLVAHLFSSGARCIAILLLACAAGCGDEASAPKSAGKKGGAPAKTPQTSLASPVETANPAVPTIPTDGSSGVPARAAADAGLFEPQSDGPTKSFGFELSKAIRVGGLEFDLIFDRTKFKAGEIVKGPQVEGFLCVPNANLPTGAKVGCVAMPNDVKENEGQLFTMSFFYKDEAPTIEDLAIEAKVIDEFAKTSDVQLVLVPLALANAG